MSNKESDFDYAIEIIDQRCIHLENYIIPLEKCNCNKDVEKQVNIRNKLNQLHRAQEKLKAND